jgi:hypothetical protein
MPQELGGVILLKDLKEWAIQLHVRQNANALDGRVTYTLSTEARNMINEQVFWWKKGPPSLTHELE